MTLKCFSFMISVGKTSNYVILMAQLYSKGQCHGIHSFVVQIRSLEDHKPMPGTIFVTHHSLSTLSLIPEVVFEKKNGRNPGAVAIHFNAGIAFMSGLTKQQ